MRRNEARATLDAARDWEAKGMFKPGAFAHIERELQGRAEEPSLAMQSFYAIGGILLGAATAALYALLQTNDLMSDAQSVAWTFFFVFAVAFIGAGIGVHFARQKELGDAMLLAGMVPLAVLLGPETPGRIELLWGLPFVGALGIIAFRRQAHLVPIAALGLACVALPVFLFQTLESGLDGVEGASWAWLIGALVLWGGMAAWNRFAPPAFDDEASVLTTLGAGAAWIAVTALAFQPDFDGGYEVVIALGLAVLIGAGILLRQRGIIFTAGLGLTVDTIVFAFDFGGTTVGLLTLILIAGGLIAAATMLRRRKAQTSTAR